MTRAFSEAAQFSKITPGNALKIDTVQHVADIRVDETGTVAAAATGVVGVVKSISRGPVEFNANRPFLFFVRDDRTGAVLFAGRLTDPLSAGGWP
jgi:serpin B